MRKICNHQSPSARLLQHGNRQRNESCTRRGGVVRGTSHVRAWAWAGRGGHAATQHTSTPDNAARHDDAAVTDSVGGLAGAPMLVAHPGTVTRAETGPQTTSTRRRDEHEAKARDVPDQSGPAQRGAHACLSAFHISCFLPYLHLEDTGQRSHAVSLSTARHCHDFGHRQRSISHCNPYAALIWRCASVCSVAF